jgi:hypothetical protein
VSAAHIGVSGRLDAGSHQCLPGTQRPASMAHRVTDVPHMSVLGRSRLISGPRRCVESRVESVILLWTGLETSLRILFGSGLQ